MTKIEIMRINLDGAIKQIKIELSSIADHRADLRMWEIEKQMILDEIKLEEENELRKNK